MPVTRFAASALILGIFMTDAEAGGPAPPAPAPRRPVGAADAAKLPAPGTAIPGSFGFTPDGSALTFLKSESGGLARVLWRVDTAGGPPRVVARPPGEGDTEANVSREEALRRERLRLLSTGIAQVVRASGVDAAVIPLSGDLYLQHGDGPLARLTGTPGVEVDPKPTADASRIAFVRDGELSVLDVATGRESRLTRGATDGLTHGLAEFIAQEELDRFTGYWWSPDGKFIAYQETDERHIPAYTIAHQGGGEPSVETHRYPFPGAANAQVRLGVVPAAGGETTWLPVAAPGEDFYLARVEWDSPSTLLVQILSRDQKTLTLARIDAGTGSRQVLIAEHRETWVNLHDDLRVIRPRGEILWSSESGAAGRRRLELHDRDGSLIRVLTPDESNVDPSAAHSGLFGVVSVDARRREVWFMASRGTPLESHLFRASLDGGPIIPVTTEPGVHRAAVSGDGEHYVDIVSNLATPPVATLRDRAGRLVATLGDGSDDSRPGELGLTPPELVTFSSRDGVTLHGAYYAPKSKALGPTAPLIVMLYGGPHVQYVSNSWALTADLKAQFLTERGFAVFKMDNRGSARRGHAFEAALNRRMGTVEVRDQVDGVRFIATSKAEVDASRVGVTGGSYGGYMTLRCLTLAPDVFHAGVAHAPVVDWDGYDTGYTERYMGTPADNPDGYRDSSVLAHVDQLRGKLLLIHGLLDENVHFRHTARLVSALIVAGKPFEILPLPEDRHSSRRESGRKYEIERMAAFFESALAPK